ncbi:MAG TPA: bifunctional tRNA (5-methylaminomethyl-2-thiouridine)(34)-methyltransferase MnmD/FAD-dependent 5-carboxymethylaminomethyl-2-thiouridine(34) oxidoreductase MnmC [Burkholderiales bacterium]|jgi:tRNA 5-methylaminomethyl-2-thiouridine biosynthesis bifunctional protein
MPAILQPAELVLDAEGVPYAPAYGDVYHSRAGGYAQARKVFLAGNGLPHAWGGRRHFTILETGFGLGTNFLATWEAWRADPARPARLHFVSIERHPFRAADLAAWHGREARMAPLVRELAGAWPVLTAGVHRIELDQGRVILTVAFGEAAALLAQLRLRADALFLDGFAPARNPEMWSAPVFEGLARAAAAGATLATYTVARAVADGLTAAGFAVRKAPGFGGKRDMLVGRREAAAASDAPDWSERHALVIGAGIAGLSAADCLAARGWRVTLLEGEGGVARGASSTPAGAMHALLSRDDNRLTRFTRAAYLHMGGRLAALAGEVDWSAACGRVDCVDEGESVEAAAQLVAGLGLPADFVTAVDASAASDLAGARVARGGFWFPRTAWLHAGAYCEALLRERGEFVSLKTGQEVARLERTEAGWSACDAAGGVLAAAPVAILAGGLDLPRLLPGGFDLPLQRVRGQLTGVPAQAAHAPRVIVSGYGYCLPPVRGMMWSGASYFPRDTDVSARPEEHRANLARVADMLPENDFTALPAGLAAHVGFRAVSPDRLPLVGAAPQWEAVTGAGVNRRGFASVDLPRQHGLYLIGGLGSRGLTWAALAGEIVASQIDGEPLPVEADLLESIDPARFLVRRLKRGQA